VAGVWSVVVALAAAIATVIACNWSRLPALRQSMDAGANASVLPALSVASLVGFGAVIAALPAFVVVRDWVLGIEGGPLVSLAVATMCSPRSPARPPAASPSLSTRSGRLTRADLYGHRVANRHRAPL
jgi:hypothetical protein